MPRSLALVLAAGLVLAVLPGAASPTAPPTNADPVPGWTDAVVSADGTVRTAALTAVAADPDAVTVTSVEILVDDTGTEGPAPEVGAAPETGAVQSVDDPVVAATTDDGALVTAVLETDGFQTAGVTWPDGQDVAGLDVRIRTRDTAGSWSEWEPLEVADDGPDAGSPDATAKRAGTDPIWVGEADAVQLSIAGGAAPDGASLTLVDVPAADAQASAATVAAEGAEVVGAATVQPVSDAPQVITRQQWGARPQVCQPAVATSLVGAVIHHTAGSNNYSTVAQAMQQIRGDQAYHIDGRGWCDIGYNFVVDKWGNIYEGRADSLTKPVIGVHAGGFNTGTVGISMLGTYTAAPPVAVVQSVTRIVGWRLGYYGVNPDSSMTYFTAGGENSKIPANTTITLPRVFGHRDVANTACPGNGGYSVLPSIRAGAAAYSFDQRFAQAKSVVRAMYADLLGRTVDPSGLATWSAALVGGAGQTQLVNSLTASEEYVRLRITDAYREALDRAPDAAGMAHWYQRIRSGTATVDDVKRRFYDSDEYVARSGGTAEGYVDLLYRNMFERPAAERERTYWAEQMAVIGRSRVVDAIWFSYEAALYRAGGYYRTFLQREPESAGQAYWAKVLLAQGEGAVRIGIAGSEEYRLLALRRFG